jgi:intein/homing endonuclease
MIIVVIIVIILIKKTITVQLQPQCASRAPVWSRLTTTTTELIRCPPSKTEKAFSLIQEKLRFNNNDIHNNNKAIITDYKNNNNKEFSYSKVVLIPHGPNEVVSEFLRITTSSGKAITLTDTHMILSGHCDSELNLKMAKDVKVGYCFLTMDGWVITTIIIIL